MGNEVFELDGEPALALYRRYLGELADGLPGTGLLFPLQVRTDDRPEPVVRTLLAIDEQTQSVTFAADIPQGSRAQLMRTNVDGLLDGAERAAEQAAPAGTSGPMLAVAISCVGRRMVMSERTEEEAEATLSVLPPGTVQVGFYSYGEISPRGSFCDLHNQTMTLTTIMEL